MADRALYELVLEKVAAGIELPPPRPPRGSAAIVLWRRAAGGQVEVFWMRRAESLAFMGGWHAFPGGPPARWRTRCSPYARVCAIPASGHGSQRILRNSPRPGH